MKGPPSPKELMAKANQALASAHLLIETGDTNGASNRAYYAMHDAARAALLATDNVPPSGLPKTHSGLISLFGKALVKKGPLLRDLGRQLRRAERHRLVADYGAGSVTLKDAQKTVEYAEAFLAVIQETLLS